MVAVDRLGQVVIYSVLTLQGPFRELFSEALAYAPRCPPFLSPLCQAHVHETRQTTATNSPACSSST